MVAMSQGQIPRGLWGRRAKCGHVVDFRVNANGREPADPGPWELLHPVEADRELDSTVEVHGVKAGQLREECPAR